ncbi:hypothetical protein BD413DRAFT_578379 [Trametes elegans]|nr:hypothetical protein BD413DRAFT_578379 [Trametes elegans]
MGPLRTRATCARSVVSLISLTFSLARSLSGHNPSRSSRSPVLPSCGGPHSKSRFFGCTHCRHCTIFARRVPGLYNYSVIPFAALFGQIY